MAFDSGTNVAIKTLRQRPDLLDQVAAWHHRECLRQGIQTTLAKRKTRLHKHLSTDNAIPQTWLALNARHLVGCISLVSYHLTPIASQEPEPEPLWLSNLYVQPDFRCTGVGTQLVDFVAAFARGVGESELWLMASEQTEFYHQRGWQLVRQARIAKQPVNVMRRAL
ncbi:GNAT family N-acetyltransferase [Gilvimarinus agarilyticus]|nr:GNAT family N-acetyltransferase [Gilvimarinus agarilyticus]